MTIDSWDAAVAYALTLPDTELGTSYRQPAVKVRSNGRTLLNVGNEPDTSFALHLDAGSIDLLKETDPDTYWQSPHYEGYAWCWSATAAPIRSGCARRSPAGATTSPR